MRRIAVFLPASARTCLVLALLAGFVGCATRGNVELLEARLRDQEDRNAQLEKSLEQTREETRIAREDADALRGQLAGRGDKVLLPEQADALFRARKLEINQLLTAGVDGDGVPGDEGITTVVTPVDGMGRPIRLPGELVVVMTPADDDTPFQRWVIPPEESRKLWQRDLLAGGFRLQLPLEGRPPENVRIAAQLKTADGRMLDATHSFALRLEDTPVDRPVPPVPTPEPLDDPTDEFAVGARTADDFAIDDFEVDEPSTDDFVVDGFATDEFATDEFDEASFAPETGVRRTAARPTEVPTPQPLHFPVKRDGTTSKPPRFAPLDGTDDPNGNGLDRRRPVRTSDDFRFDDGTIPRYN